MPATQDARTALIVHGYHLHREDWEHVVWGHPRSQSLGRIPAALLVAYQRRPSLIIWNTGASQKDGVKEGSYMLETAVKLIKSNKLAHYFPQFDGIDRSEFVDYITQISLAEVDSMNTSEALANAVQFLVDSDGKTPMFDEVINVSSGNHVPRILRDCMIMWNEKRGLLLRPSGYPADTNYAGGKVSDVGIKELSDEVTAAYQEEGKTLRATGRITA